MDIEKYTKKIYDKFGQEYQKTREEKRPERAFNEFLEMPCMFKAVGNIKEKKLLDVGCGAGVHIKKYLKKGALCSGIDLSETMISFAREKNKNVHFNVGTITKLPYKNNSFGIVTASLMIDYVKNLNKAFSEVNRVLKKGGLFYYSDMNPATESRDIYENKEIKIDAFGYVEYKKTGKIISLGRSWLERIDHFEMVPGMKVKFYKRMFRTHLNALIKSGFELVDFIDCRPVKEFKKYNSKEYEMLTKFPMFSIYVARKK